MSMLKYRGPRNEFRPMPGKLESDRRCSAEERRRRRPEIAAGDEGIV